MSKPKLLIIAGPNGSGKSNFGKRYAESYLGNNIDQYYFNGDERKRELLQQPRFQKIDEKYREREVEEELDKLWYELHDNAIDNKHHFCYETNFAEAPDYRSMNEARHFKYHGFEIAIHFYDTVTLELSKQRVQFRHQFDNGHNVTSDAIEKNFYRSAEQIQKFYKEFDTVRIYLNDIDLLMPRLFFQKDGKISKFSWGFTPHPLAQRYSQLIKENSPFSSL